jgi:hypothetical protein
MPQEAPLGSSRHGADGMWVGSSAWLEHTPDKREVDGSSPSRPTSRLRDVDQISKPSDDGLLVRSVYDGRDEDIDIVKRETSVSPVSPCVAAPDPP